MFVVVAVPVGMVVVMVVASMVVSLLLVVEGELVDQGPALALVLPVRHNAQGCEKYGLYSRRIQGTW